MFEDERRNVRMLRNAVCLFFFFSVLTSIASAQHGKKK